MQVGDLVKLLDHPDVHGNNPELDPDAIGIIVEHTCHGLDGPLGSAWIRWSGKTAADCLFVEDLEVSSASR